MKTNRTKIKDTVTVLVFMLALLLPFKSFAGDFTNIGFTKNVPSEIKAAFPMADEFLDIKWIDKKRYIGKLRAEVWVGKEKIIQNIVVFSKAPCTYGEITTGNAEFCESDDPSFFKKGFDDFMRQADISQTKWIKAVKGKKKKDFFCASGPFYNLGNPYINPRLVKMRSFSGFTKNVFMIHPDGKTIVLVESKKPFQDENLSDELKQKYESLLAIVKNYLLQELHLDEKTKMDISFLKDADALDVNFDGVDDYISVLHLKKEREIDVVRYVLMSKNGGYKMVVIPKDECAESDVHKAIISMVGANTFMYNGCCLNKLEKGGN